MRYLDTGSRNPAHTLGTWLDELVANDASVVALRWQSGFFGAAMLGYFADVMARLRASDGILHLLVGSNDGATTRADVEALLVTAGPPRKHQLIGIVRFENAYYHPKTVHLVRADGSSAAYVGSANLTGSGTASLHVEAGISCDTRDGDDPSLLAAIADCTDRWFEARPHGLHLVTTPQDLDALVLAGVLNVPRPVLASPPGTRGAGASATHPRLSPLVPLPGLPSGVVLANAPLIVAGAPPPPAIVPTATPSTTLPSAAAQWSKRLTRSDAQRKRTGNQRGSVTLVQAGHPIDGQRYFRFDLFGSESWSAGQTRTGETLEIVAVPFSVRFLGTDLGRMSLDVTYAPNRESAQSNYTSLLHLGPLATQFLHHDLTGHVLEVARSGGGSFTLTIR